MGKGGREGEREEERRGGDGRGAREGGRIGKERGRRGLVDQSLESVEGKQGRVSGGACRRERYGAMEGNVGRGRERGRGVGKGSERGV